MIRLLPALEQQQTFCVTQAFTDFTIPRRLLGLPHQLGQLIQMVIQRLYEILS
jgi:hypothetical protein